MSKLRGSVYLIAANLISAAIAFFSVPFFMRWFGVDGYSGCLYVVAIWGYVSLVCPDFATGAQKRLTEDLAAGRRESAIAVNQAQIAGVLANVILAMILGIVFGLVFRLPGHGAPNFPIMAAFLFAAMGFSFRSLSATINAVLAAGERFGAMAVRQSIETLVGAVAAVVLAYMTRSPAALLLGGAIGAAMGLAVNLVILRCTEVDFPILPALNRKVLQDLVVLHFKAWPHSIVNQMAGGLDRVLLPLAGGPRSVVANYANPYRLPETLSGVLAPAIDTIVPNLTQQAAADAEGFARAIDRYGLQALMFATAFILVPSGWGGPFLKLWLRQFAPAGGALVVLLIGFYFCLNFYFSTLTRAFRATGDMHFVVPFSGLNAIATLLFTIPAAHWAGIVGVAAMNAIINGVQIVPFAFFVRKAAANHFPAFRHALKAVGTVALGSAAACGCYCMSSTPIVSSRPWLCLVFAPVASLAMFAVLAYVKPAPIPSGLARFMPRALRPR